MSLAESTVKPEQQQRPFTIPGIRIRRDDKEGEVDVFFLRDNDELNHELVFFVS